MQYGSYYTRKNGDTSSAPKAKNEASGQYEPWMEAVTPIMEGVVALDPNSPEFFNAFFAIMGSD